MPALGAALGLPFLHPALLGGWTPADATTANLVQWLYDLDSGAGSPWLLDKSQTGDERILNGGPGLQQGRCMDFDGTNDYIDVADDAALNFGAATSFSVSAWVRSDQTGSTKFFLGKGDHNDSGAAGSGYVMYLGTAGLQWTVGAWDGSSNKTATWATAASASTWYHVTMTLNRSTDELKLYVDADLKHTVSTVGLGDIDVGSSSLYLGRNQGYWDGQLFGVHIYNDVLAAAEITWLKNFGAAGTDPTATNLVGRWLLDEQTGTTHYDSSGEGNHGTGTNSPTHSTQDKYSWQNSIGYSLSGAVFVPRDESDTANDVLGSALDYAGTAPRHGRLVSNNCVTVNGSTQYAIVTGALPTTTGELAIKFQATALNGIMLGCNNASAHRCYLGINASGKLAAGIGSDSWATHVAATTLVTGQWYDAKVTWDGVNVKIYYKTLNTGTETAWTLDYTGTENGSLPTSTGIGVGCNNGNGTPGNYFNGDLCDVRLNATDRYPLANQTSGGDPNGLWNVMAYEAGTAWLNSPSLGTQDIFDWLTTKGFTDAAGTIREALSDGTADTNNDAITNPAVAGHNGSLALIDFDNYNIPAFQNLGFSVYHNYDLITDDLNSVDQWFVRRVTQESEETDFVLYDGDLTGADWDAIHAYIETVAQLNARAEHYWSLNSLSGSGPQLTGEELALLTLSGGMTDAEVTTTGKNGNGIYLEDTGGSADATLTCTAPAGLNLNLPITHCGWVKVVSPPDGGDQRILDQNTGGQTVKLIESGGALQWNYNGTIFNGPDVVTDGAWHFYMLARDAAGNLSFWVDGVYQAVSKGATMGAGTGTLLFFEDGDASPLTANPVVVLDEHSAFGTLKLRDNHHGFLWNGNAGKFLNTTSNEFEA